jgi:hypothetical protein
MERKPKTDQRREGKSLFGIDEFPGIDPKLPSKFGRLLRKAANFTPKRPTGI